jgi:hypothetical protein
MGPKVRSFLTVLGYFKQPNKIKAGFGMPRCRTTLRYLIWVIKIQSTVQNDRMFAPIFI